MSVSIQDIHHRACYLVNIVSPGVGVQHRKPSIKVWCKDSPGSNVRLLGLPGVRVFGATYESNPENSEGAKANIFRDTLQEMQV